MLTDTNRRTDTVLGRLAGNQGPLLPAGATPGVTRALFSTADQTTLTVTAAPRSTASRPARSFGPLAEAVPENAFDGDPATSWQFGDFGTADGQHLDVQLAVPRRVDSVAIRRRRSGRCGSAGSASSSAAHVDTAVRLPATAPSVPLRATANGSG